MTAKEATKMKKERFQPVVRSVVVVLSFSMVGEP
jgi:hypothetical protein